MSRVIRVGSSEFASPIIGEAEIKILTIRVVTYANANSVIVGIEI